MEHLNRLHSNPEYKAKLLEGLKIRNASKEHQEHLKRIQLSKSHSVIVFDTLNNETTVLPSIQEAARSIGSSFNNVRVAIKGIKETGDSIKWEDLLYWLKTSSIISKDEIEKLSLLLKNKDYNEFFKNIPRFLKYSQNMFSDYYILDGNIYISEDDFDFYFGAYAAGRTPASQDVSLPLDKTKFI